MVGKVSPPEFGGRKVQAYVSAAFAEIFTPKVRLRRVAFSDDALTARAQDAHQRPEFRAASAISHSKMVGTGVSRFIGPIGNAAKWRSGARIEWIDIRSRTV